MTIAWLLLMLKRVGYFALDNWKVILPVVAGAIVLFWIFGWAFCSPANNDKLKEEILKDKIEANVLANQANEQRKDANEKANNVNAALGNLNNSLNRDSSQSAGNAEDRFCKKFPGDSSCFEWCKRHECKPTN